MYIELAKTSISVSKPLWVDFSGKSTLKWGLVCYIYIYGWKDLPLGSKVISNIMQL